MLLAETTWPDVASVLIQGLVAVVLAYLAVMQARAKTQFDEVKANIQKIETATNSMKDALVLKTEDEALLRGASNERNRAADQVSSDQAAVRRHEQAIYDDIPADKPLSVVLATEDIEKGGQVATKRDVEDALKDATDDQDTPKRKR